MTDTKNIYWSAIETFGYDLQIAVAIEEMAALTKELCKAQRVTFAGRGGLGDGLIDNYDEIAENYDETMGEAICMGKVKDKVWMLLGFLLQTAVNGTRGDATCSDDR